MKQDESKQAAHTPGNWKVYAKAKPNKHGVPKLKCYVYADQDHGTPIICSFHHFPDEVKLANAQIVAQAPETARKLKELAYAAADGLSMLDQYCDCGDNDWDQGVFDRLEAAIKKATQ